MSQHPPELVERVARQMRLLFYPTRPSMDDIARYALDLAERAADEAVTEYRLNDAPGNDSVLTRAVRRAVEGA